MILHDFRERQGYFRLAAMHRPCACRSGTRPYDPISDFEVRVSDLPAGAGDIRPCNLRNCTKQQNSLNKARYRNGVSRYKGVYQRKGSDKWYASIQARGKQAYLGEFDSAVEAALAYDAAARKLHGPFAAINFPERGISPAMSHESKGKSPVHVR